MTTMQDPRIDPSSRQLRPQLWTDAIDSAMGGSQFPTVAVHGLESSLLRGHLSTDTDPAHTISQPREDASSGELYGACLRPMMTKSYVQPVSPDPINAHQPPANLAAQFVVGSDALPTAHRSMNLAAFSGEHGPRALPEPDSRYGAGQRSGPARHH
jgi:hypothetical protein